MQHKIFENKSILLYFDSSDANWHIRNDKGDDFKLLTLENLSVFLQIFYEDPQSFFNVLFAKFKDGILSDKALHELPFKKSIIFCIRNKMFFWVELAIKWLEFITVDDELRKAIETIINDPKVSQNIRHRLKKFGNISN